MYLPAHYPGAGFSTALLVLGLLRGRGRGDPALPDVPDITSPGIVGTLRSSRRRIAQRRGRQSTLLTGGLLDNPALLRQGLKP
jgi:hypothetical protein